MDSFCEQIVKRKITKKIIGVKIAVWAITMGLGLLATGLFVYLGFKMEQSLLFIFAVFAFGAAIYMSIKFSRSLNLEYEYSFTNGCFDIDKISAKTNRTRLITADCKNIEKFGRYKEAEHANRQYNKTITAYSVITSPDIYYAVIRQPEAGSVLVIFEPDENSVEHLGEYMPRHIWMDYKRNENIK